MVWFCVEYFLTPPFGTSAHKASGKPLLTSSSVNYIGCQCMFVYTYLYICALLLRKKKKKKRMCFYLIWFLKPPKNLKQNKET